MSQKEQWEVICRGCRRKDILDHEPPEDYMCYICGPKLEPEKHSLDKPQTINLKQKGWWCPRHKNTFKHKESCPECLLDPPKKVMPGSAKFLNPQSTENELAEIQIDTETRQLEREIRKKAREHQKAIQQAPLDTLVLMKQFIENEKKSSAKLDKLIKVLGEKK